MFIDVRGYTGMASKQAPEELADRIASFHRWSRQEIERRHGLVDKFAGDAVMATFNVSGARVDHCVQALQAAFAIRDKAAATGLPVGTGIAVGAAMVGTLTQGANLSVVGEVTNLASRLQAQAAAGEILLSEEAHRRVQDWLASHELVPHKESIELKGFEKPVPVYRLRSGAHTGLAQAP
jgi:adenylate cyclase